MHALLYKDFRVMWKQMKAFLLLIAIFCLIPNQALKCLLCGLRRTDAPHVPDVL